MPAALRISSAIGASAIEGRHGGLCDHVFALEYSFVHRRELYDCFGRVGVGRVRMRVLGSALADALIGLPYSVSTEEELALRSQRLDVLIIEQAGALAANAQPPAQRPDGLEDLAKHNLLSFKAADEPFSAFSAEELLSHAVTYRKVASLRALRVPAPDEDDTLAEPKERYRLLPAADFRCFAVTTRFPRQLVKQLLPGSCQTTETPGIYHLRFGTQAFRLVVINQLDPHPRNAPWGLFATEETRWRAAFGAYCPHSDIGIHLHNLIGIFAWEMDTWPIRKPICIAKPANGSRAFCPSCCPSSIPRSGSRG